MAEQRARDDLSLPTGAASGVATPRTDHHADVTTHARGSARRRTLGP
jgi:hypothetical protein